MARKKKSLGEFRRGRWVRYSSYRGFGSVHNAYGKVVSVDAEESVFYVQVRGRNEPFAVKYPTPTRDNPSSWACSVMSYRDVPYWWRDFDRKTSEEAT